MGISASDILNQVQNSNQVIDLGAAKIELNLSDAAALSTNTSEVLQQAAKDASLVSATQSAAQLATQTARQKIGIDFGTDANAQNEVYTRLAGIIQQENTNQENAKAAIDQKNGTSFLDDPLGWLSAKLTINQDIQAHNAANQNKQAAFEQIKALNEATSTSAQLQTQFSNSVTQASSEAAARMVATQATVQSNQASIQSLVYNNDAIKEALSATKEKLANTFSLNRAQNEDAQLGIAQASLALREEEFNWRKDEKAKSDQFDSSIVQSINIGRGIRGLPPLDQVKASVAATAIRGNSPAALEFMADYHSGEIKQATGDSQLGSTAADVMARFGSGQPINLSPAQDIIKQKLGDAAGMVTSSPAFNPKDVTQNNANFNKAALIVLKKDASEVKPNDSSNVFSIAPIAQIVKASPAAAAEPVYTKILAPLMNTGVDLNDPNNVIAATVKGIQDGTITYNDAIGLTTLYQAGAAANLAQKDLPKFGIPDINAWKTYNVRLGSGFGSSIIDLTKPDLVGRYINKQLLLQQISGGDARMQQIQTGQ